MIAIDTNIWIYSHDSRDARKQMIAQQVIASARPLVLPWQVGCEFIAATRKLAPLGFSRDDAWIGLEEMRKMADAVAIPNPADWSEARAFQQSNLLSFWD